MSRQTTGQLGEKFARDFLKKRGYKIIETNYRCTRGEIDIVARRKSCLVFVEVRSKSNLDYGTPAESITAAKRKRMRTTAFQYLQDHPESPEDWRIDVVAVELDESGKLSKIELIENAVGAG